MKLIFSGNQPELERLVYASLSKQVRKKHKEPKGRAEDGAYCPKGKTGQSWAHVKNKKEEEDDV